MNRVPEKVRASLVQPLVLGEVVRGGYFVAGVGMSALLSGVLACASARTHQRDNDGAR